MDAMVSYLTSMNIMIGDEITESDATIMQDHTEKWLQYYCKLAQEHSISVKVCTTIISNLIYCRN